MIPPDSSVPLTGQFEYSTPVIQSHVQGCEWGRSETSVPSTSTLLGLTQEQEAVQFPSGFNWNSFPSSSRIPNSLCLGPRFPDTSPYSTSVDQVNLDLAVAENHASAFLESDQSFDSNNSDSAFTSLDPIQDGIPWIFPGPEFGSGIVLTEDLPMSSVLQISDEVPGYSIPSAFVPLPISYAANPYPQTSSLGQDMEGGFQTTNPYAFPSEDIPPPDWATGQPAARFPVENPFIFNPMEPTTGINIVSYLGESFRAVDYENPSYTASPPLEQQSSLSERPASHCKWEDENGTECGKALTRASLPGHLSTHGIKNKSRNYLMKCNWAGCRRKKPMNRESIVRHIREVHLRIKRPPKHPYL